MKEKEIENYKILDTKTETDKKENHLDILLTTVYLKRFDILDNYGPSLVFFSKIKKKRKHDQKQLKICRDI